MLVRPIHYGDMLAIPFFFLLSVYFYEITDKSVLEYVFMVFVMACFVIDIVFTYMYARSLMPYVVGLVGLAALAAFFMHLSSPYFQRGAGRVSV
jgi:hypothetical protein